MENILSSLFYGGTFVVHVFQMKGKKIAYDSEVASIHELDDLAYDVLRLFVEMSGSTPPMKEFQNLAQEKAYEFSEVLACRDELIGLISQGQLFAPCQPFEYQDLYPEEPAIKAMCLHICHDCNLRCKYCFAGTGDFGTGKRSMLDLETGKKAIDFLLAASGNRHHLDVDFFGGEPLMNWPVVVSLTEYCERKSRESGKEIRLTITTNAVMLDEDKTKFINDHMKNCVLSIDGRPEVHDKMRPGIGGSGSYERVFSRIKSFLLARNAEDAKYHEHYVRGTFTRENLDFSLDVIHLAEVLGARQISVEPVVAESGSGYDIRLSDLPQIEKEYEDLAEYISKTREQKDPVHFFHFIMDMKGGPCVYKRLKGCGVGAEYCAVTPTGDIYPCHQFVGEEKYLMGNVHNLEQILDENGNMKTGKKATDILSPDVRKTFIDRLMPNKEACKACFARYNCGGGCPANSVHATGDLDGMYEVGCRLAKKRMECSIWLSLSSLSN